MNTHQKSAGATITGLTALLVLAALSVLGAGSAHAQGSITTTGAVEPSPPLPANSTAPGPITVTDVSTVIGVGDMPGTLMISGGATLDSANNADVAFGSVSGSGAVTVTGPGSTWSVTDNEGDFALAVSRTGPGTLTISNGGKVTLPDFLTSPGIVSSCSGDAVVGYTSSGVGVLNVTSGGTLKGRGLLVGSQGDGTLNISDGGTVVLQQITVIGRFLGGNGTVNVNSGGTLEVLDTLSFNFENGSDPTAPFVGGLIVGDALNGGGTGTLNIKGGVVVSLQGTVVGKFAGSMGTVNINSGGILETEALEAGEGTAQVNFDDGTLRALSNDTSPTQRFIRGFSGTELNIASGGLTIDTNGFTVSTDTSSAFTGAGTLTKTGSGTLTLDGSNSYTGATTIAKGTLALGMGGSIAASSGVALIAPGTKFDISGGGDKTIRDLSGVADSEVTLGPNTLTAGTANSTTFAGVISGTGGFTKQGSGTLTILGENTFSGGTTILDGTLVVGNLPGSHNEAEGISTALGTGNVLVDPGTLRTTSFQTGKPVIIQVHGDYTQKANGTLVLGIGGLAGNQYDRVVVAGAANLNGTLQVFSLNNFHPSPGNEFGIFRNGGTRTGNFTLDDSQFNNANIPRELRPVAVELVAPNGVDLVYLKGPLPPGTKPPIIDVIPPPDKLPPVNPEAPIPEEDVEQLLDPTAEQLTALFEIPFSSANIQRFNLDDRMTQIQRGLAGFVSPPPPAPPPATGKEALGKETAGKAPPPPPPAPAPRWGVWANGWGEFVNVDDAGLAKGYRFTTGGMSAGIDYRITDHLAVGLFGGYSHTWTDFRPGNADVDTGRGGFYATYFDPTGWWVNVGAWGGYNSYSTSRQALLGLANGSTDGYEVSTFGDAGYNIYCGKLTFGPIVAMQYTTAHISGFTEHGSLVPLDIHADSEDSLRTDLGAQASYNWQVGKIIVIPGLKLAWQHEFKYSNLPLTVSAPLFGAASTTLNGPNLGHDSLLINANVGIQITSRIWATIGYDGQVARDHYSSHTVTGTFSYSF